MIGQSCVNKDGGCSTLSLSEESACRSLFGPLVARRRRGKASKTKSESVHAAMDFPERGEGLEVGDVVAYKEFFRMTKEQFCFLLGKVSPLIQKKEQPTPINAVRATIQPDERLAVTLRYLATGETYHSLEYSLRISRQTISSIVSEHKPSAMFFF